MSFTFKQLMLALGIKKHTEEQYDDNDDPKVNIHTLYKHRWVWYHFILCIQMILTRSELRYLIKEAVEQKQSRKLTDRKLFESCLCSNIF